MKPLVQFQRVKRFKKVERERIKQIHRGGRSRSRGRETWILGFLQDRAGFPKTWRLGEVMGEPGGEMLLFPFNSGPGK